MVKCGVFFAVKVKVSRYTPWRRIGGKEANSYSYLTSAT
jgi:hypothetical protein